MDFQQIRDFVNPAVAQATGLQEVDNLQMPVPVAYVPVQLVIDGELSLTSENPVQNKVIAVAIQNLDGRITAIEGQFSEGVTEAVNNWLAAHPEATTTVQDGAITYAKLDANLKGEVDQISDLKSALSGISSETRNLFIFKEGTFNGVTFKYLPDGGLSVKGTATATANNIVDLGESHYGKYSLTVDSVSQSFSTTQLMVVLRKADGSNYVNIDMSGTHGALTGENDASYAIKKIDITVFNGVTYDTVLYIQFEMQIPSTAFVSPFSAFDRIARETLAKNTLQNHGIYPITSGQSLADVAGEGVWLVGNTTPPDMPVLRTGYLFQCTYSGTVYQTYIANEIAKAYIRAKISGTWGNWVQFFAIDTTLSISGQGADAKAVGDALLPITEATSNLFSFKDTTDSGVSIERLADGGLKITGTCTSSKNIQQYISPFYGAYSLECISTDQSFSENQMFVVVRNSAKQQIGLLNMNGKRTEISGTAYENNKIEVIDITVISGVTYNTTLYIQLLNSGSTSEFISPYSARDNVVRNLIAFPSKGTKITVIGDSITEHNFRANKNWVDRLAEKGYTVQNLGISGTGFAMTREESRKRYIYRIDQIDSDCDLIGITTSVNDIDVNVPVGNVSDSGTGSLCGYVNEFFDELLRVYPTKKICCYTESPKYDAYYAGTNADSAKYRDYIEAVGEICKIRGIPFKAIYASTILRPWISENNAYYFKAPGQSEPDGIHPNDAGHQILFNHLYPFFVECLNK